MKPRDRSIISFGCYLGLFSWNNHIDPIICHRVFRVSLNVSEKDFEAAMQMFFHYTGLASESYRHRKESIYPGKHEVLKHATTEFRKTFDRVVDDNSTIREMCAVQYKIARGVMGASLKKPKMVWQWTIMIRLF